jgi:hypothetical protein
VSVTVIFSLSVTSGNENEGVSFTVIISISVTIAGGGGGVLTPVPESAMVCPNVGELPVLGRLLSPIPALSRIPNDPDKGPREEGSNCTVNVQELPGLMVTGNCKGNDSATPFHTTAV